MAKYIPSALGLIKGKLGNLVLYKRLGQPVARTAPAKRNAKPSAAQLAQRNKFSLAIQLLDQLRPVLAALYPGVGQRNAAVRRVSSSLLHLLAADQEAGMLPDYSRLCITEGSIQGLPEPEISRIQPDLLHIDWLQEAYLSSDLSAQDQLNLLCYLPERSAFSLVPDFGKRSDHGFNLQLPAGFGDLHFHSWLFVRSAKGKGFSEAVYLGLL